MRTLRLIYRLLLLTWPRAARVEQGRELEEMFLYCRGAQRLTRQPVNGRTG